MSQDLPAEELDKAVSVGYSCSMRLGQKLRQLRQQQDLSQQAVADQVGVNRAYVAQLESGQRANPTLDLLVKLGKALGVTASYLIDDMGPLASRQRSGSTRARNSARRGGLHGAKG
jgi:transcriptional regulator with XRE-family HTH domain